MAKTLALFFVLGMMVSCASHQNDRSISSLDDTPQRHHHYFYDRSNIR